MSWEPVSSRRDPLRWSVTAAVVVVPLASVVLGVGGWRNRSVSQAPGDARATARLTWGGKPPPHTPGQFTIRRWPAAPAESVPADEALRVEGAGDRTLVVADPLSLYEVDLATGAVRRLRLSDGAWGPLTEPLMTVGGDVITTTSAPTGAGSRSRPAASSSCGTPSATRYGRCRPGPNASVD